MTPPGDPIRTTCGGCGREVAADLDDRDETFCCGAGCEGRYHHEEGLAMTTAEITDLPPAVAALVEQGRRELADDAAAERQMREDREAAERSERRGFHDRIRAMLVASAGLPADCAQYVDEPDRTGLGRHRTRVSLPGCRPVYVSLDFCCGDVFELEDAICPWETVPPHRTICDRYPSFARAVAVAHAAVGTEVPF